VASLRSISVVGSRSGRHMGRVEDYSGGLGASFLPARSFTAGETVTVHVHLDVVNASNGTFRFVIGNAVPVSGAVQHHYRTSGPGVLHFTSESSFAPQRVKVTQASSTVGEGDFFIAPKGASGQPGPMILNSAGQLVWFHPLSDPNAYAMNFSEQRLEGSRVLTWWRGDIVDGHGQGEDVIMNSSYHTVAVIHAGNGFQADLHDFRLLGETAWITSYQALRWNLTRVGGSSSGLVWDGIVQEVDIRTGLVMYEWHSLDHVPVAASYVAASKSAGSMLDYFHVNSIDVVSPEEIVVSSRDTSTVYAISVSDGGVILWQLGGKRSSFSLGPGVQFNLQHDARLVNPTTVTVFDNDAGPPTYGPSKALVIELDPVTQPASLVRSISHQPALVGTSLGNVETLSDGNVLVSWGTTRYFDEHSASGTLLVEGRLVAGDDSYRTFRAPWSATPTTAPKLVLQRGANGAVTAFASWNGATDVVGWQLLEGPNTASLRTFSTVESAGFETAIPVPGHSSQAIVVVRALASDGRVLRGSPAIPLPT